MPEMGCFIHTKFTCPECHYTEVKQGAHFEGFDCPKCKLAPAEFEDYRATAHLGKLKDLPKKTLGSSRSPFDPYDCDFSPLVGKMAYFPREARRAICAKAHFDDFTPLTDRGTHEPVLEP